MVEKKSSKAPRRHGRKGDGHGGRNGKKQQAQERKNESISQVPAKKGSLLIQLTDDAPTWYSCGRQTPGRDDTITSHPPSSKGPKNSQLVSTFRAQADELYKREVQTFGNSNTSSSDEQWVENTMKRGTLKDRIAAMSVIVSTNPVHKLYALDGLLQFAANQNARMAQMAAEALEDLFLSTLLPPNRKLLSLDQRPLYLYQDGKKTLSPRILLLWRYEEMVKEKYQLFRTQYLLHTLQNGVDMNKLSALRTATALLRQAPEGEGPLLSMIVNKLGDPSRKIAAAAGHGLRQVLEEHGKMQVIVAREVQQLAHRPHLSPRALYNCIIFLNQLQLSAEETPKQNDSNRSSKVPKPMSLPASLINTYFRLFEVAVNKSKTDSTDSGIKSRLLSALLTGVNRAHPFLPEKDKDLEDHIDSLYRVVHTGPPSASTQALMLLFHVAVGSPQDETPNKAASEQVTARQNRFYRALYSTLSQPSIIGGGKHLTMYFNLLYKAMKNDCNSTRVIAFAKRLLCTTMHTNPPVTAASLFLLNEIMKHHDELKSCFVDIAEGQNAMAVLDPSKREPMAALTVMDGDSQDTVAYAHLWETSLIVHHFHPSVAKFAAGDIEYTGDPLRDFALAPFLDKFAYRNPKTAKKRGESVAERRKSAEDEMTLPVNDPSFLKRQDVDVQEEFFHKFFVERARRDEMKGIVRGGSEADDEDEAFDIAENFNTDQTFEETWETDSEEEAFVDSLAKRLIEDAAEAEMDLDDEDPDMEGWDGMYSNDDELHGMEDPDSANEEAFADRMDGMSDDDDSSEKEPNLDVGSDDNFGDDAFMDADDDSESDNVDEPTFDGPDSRVVDDEVSDDDLVIMDESDLEDEEELVLPNEKKTKTEDARVGGDFADASEYEELINKGWQEMKQQKSSHFDPDDDDSIPIANTSSDPSSGGKKKRKRRSKKKRSS